MHLPTLKRSLSLPMVTFYGLGNILGAGIYVLVGKVAGEAGYFAPLSFLVASVIAAISAFTYAELSARYPVSAGEAVYIYKGFGLQKLSLLVGLMIALAGVVSAAAIAHGFAGYLRVFFDWPRWLVVTGLLLALGLLAAWGIKQSVRVVALFTLIEIAGLLLIIIVGAGQLPAPGQWLDQIRLPGQTGLESSFSLLGIFTGAFLAFYAYTGFEDMVNIAEEVKEPERNMPRAILWCVLVSTLLYCGVTLVSVRVLSPSELAQSDAPLASVYSQATGDAPWVITLISIFAVVNGALIQLIMASRLFYGMARRQWLPGILAMVHPVTRTPVNSTVLTVAFMLFFALLFQIVMLAEMTSYLVLIVFSLLNLALIRIKKLHAAPAGVFVFPVWFPWLGFLTVTSFLLFKLYSICL